MKEHDKSFDFEADGAPPPPTTAALANLHQLVEQALRADKAATEAEEEAKRTRQLHRSFIESLIPAEMEKLGLETFTTSAGFRVSIKDDMNCSLSEERREAGMRWLEENNLGSVIKRDVTFPLAKGQEKVAERIKELISSELPSVPCVDKRHVHYQTLKALLRSRLKEGKPVDMELFKVSQVKKAEISV